MISYIRIDPIDYPIKKNEKWWVVHPNNAKAEFRIPPNAVTLCIKSFNDFHSGLAYRVLGESDGWVTVGNQLEVVQFPQYLFARHFDAEAFVCGTPNKAEKEVMEQVVEQCTNFNDETVSIPVEDSVEDSVGKTKKRAYS